MPTPTYDLIEEQTVSGTSTTQIDFTNLGTYSDIIVEVTGTNSLDDNYRLRFNTDTGSNYSITRLDGSGTSASSSRETSQTSMKMSVGNHTKLGTHVAQIMSYGNANVQKTVLIRSGMAESNVAAIVGLWKPSSPAAITAVRLYIASGYMVAGTTVRLWGVSG